MSICFFLKIFKPRYYNVLFSWPVGEERYVGYYSLNRLKKKGENVIDTLHVKDVIHNITGERENEKHKAYHIITCESESENVIHNM